VARPMPWPAAVTKARFPESLPIVIPFHTEAASGMLRRHFIFGLS
jgi:hypothetical protein